MNRVKIHTYRSSNRVDISNDVTFELNDQTNSTTALSKENLRSLTNANGFLLLSSASDELNHTLTADDVTLNFDVSDEEWIYVINDINVVTNGSRDELYASYGISTLPNVLNTAIFSSIFSTLSA